MRRNAFPVHLLEPLAVLSVVLVSNREPHGNVPAEGQGRRGWRTLSFGSPRSDENISCGTRRWSPW